MSKTTIATIATNYVSQALTESFQIKIKNKICVANVYLHSPTERDSPQMYLNNEYDDGETIFKDLTSIDFKLSFEVQ